VGTAGPTVVECIAAIVLTTRVLLRYPAGLRSWARNPDIAGQNSAPSGGTKCATGSFCCDTAIIALLATSCRCVLLLPLLQQLFVLLLLLL
jgi:hypothetical protein